MKATTVIMLAFGLLVALPAPGMADKILVSPGSIVFDDKIHTAQLIVANIGEKTSIFRLQPTFFTMKEDGGLVEAVGEPPANSAIAIVRFSPRQFELKAGESQVVRIGSRAPPSLAAGEYRMHLRVVDVGEAMAAPALTVPHSLEAEVAIRVTRAVRILVRNGVTAGLASVDGVAAKRAKNGRIDISFLLRRSGAGSSQGEYAISAQNHATGVKAADLVDRGVLVYSELAMRRISEAFPGGALKGASDICVAYRDKAAAKGDDGEKHCVAISAS